LAKWKCSVMAWSSDWAPGGRQDQARAAQVHAMQLSDQKGWSQDPRLPSPHLRGGSGSKSVLLEIPVCLRPSEGRQLLFFVSVPMVVACEQGLTCSLGLCCHCFPSYYVALVKSLDGSTTREKWVMCCYVLVKSLFSTFPKYAFPVLQFCTWLWNILGCWLMGYRFSSFSTCS